MNPHLKYKAVQSYSWTRIDMLILIYDQAVATLNEGARLIEQSKLSELPPVNLKALRILLAIADGLDLEKGDLPAQILRLVVYALDQIKTQSAESWKSAASVMTTLREGFVEIQDVARQDEYEGRIPALDAVG